MYFRTRVRIPPPPPHRSSARTGVLVVRLAIVALLTAAPAQSQESRSLGAPLQVSGIYPHLAVFNDTGSTQDNECGIGAVVPWAGKLWLITYPPHRRTGSS